MYGADMAIWVDVVDEDIIPKHFLALYIGWTVNDFRTHTLLGEVGEKDPKTRIRTKSLQKKVDTYMMMI